MTRISPIAVTIGALPLITYPALLYPFAVGFLGGPPLDDLGIASILHALLCFGGFIYPLIYRLPHMRFARQDAKRKAGFHLQCGSGRVSHFGIRLLLFIDARRLEQLAQPVA